MATYGSSHRWITFKADLRQADPSLWILLGEAASKIEHIAGTPLKPSLAEELHKVYLAKGAMATTAIEGNTLTEEQVRMAIEGKLELPKSKAYLGREVQNILGACNDMLQRLSSGSLPELTTARVKQLNGEILNGLPLDADVVPGAIREHSVTVGRYRGAPAMDCELLLDKLCNWLPTLTDSARENPEFRVPFAILQASLAHLYLAWIHPFGDGNGRTARLVEFQLLIQAGVPSPAAHLLSNHYNQTRAEYYRQLDQASRSGGEIVPFLKYAAQGLVDGLREQLRQVRIQQLDLAWRDYIRQVLADNQSTSNDRRERVLLALAQYPDGIAIADIPELTPSLTTAYAGMTRKALTRDLNALEALQLVEKKNGKAIRARTEIISAFIPIRNRK